MLELATAENVQEFEKISLLTVSANVRPGDHSYGGGPGNTHNYTTGLLHYYYCTGDPAAREAVVSLADCRMPAQFRRV